MIRKEYTNNRIIRYVSTGLLYYGETALPDWKIYPKFHRNFADMNKRTPPSQTGMGLYFYWLKEDDVPLALGNWLSAREYTLADGKNLKNSKKEPLSRHFRILIIVLSWQGHKDLNCRWFSILRPEMRFLVHYVRKGSLFCEEKYQCVHCVSTAKGKN